MTSAEFIDDPNWATFLPEVAETPTRRHLPSHEDCSHLDVEAAAVHLMRGGTLGTMPGYEERPGQIDVLKAIARAFNAREHLMIEAGTGVGKSLAYLIPAILWARLNDTPVIVSTATRNLQSQLIASDIPRALKVLGEGAEGFKVALLKGRANYLCLRAVAEFFSAGFWTMSAEEQAAMPAFIEWLQTTPDGDLDRFDALPRALLTTPGEECGGRRCAFYSRCFVRRARRAAAQAQLVVANHALVLAEAAAAGAGVLPAAARIIFDEAHNLEGVATEYLSREFSVAALNRLLNRLNRRGRGRRPHPAGILAAVNRQLARGVLAGTAAGELAGRLTGKIAALTVRVTEATQELVDAAAGMFHVAPNASELRYRVVGGAREYSLHGLFQPYRAAEFGEANLSEAQARFEGVLAELVNLLHQLAEALETSAPAGEFNFCADLAVQVRGIAEAFVDFANSVNFTLKGERSTHAYWIERRRPEGARAPTVRLVAAPLTVAEALDKLVYSLKDSVVLCSATLRVGNDFKYLAGRLGAAERFRFLTAPSPFDYLRQALVLAADCLPDPGADGAKYARELAALLKDLFELTHGRALVLFTSYEMMNQVAAAAREPLAAAGIELLVQGEGPSREALTRQLREASAATVLFGAQSFWEGVDVAGAALSCVVLARLPFAQVADPIVEARSELIERGGGSAFRDYALPEAVLRFRQGFGRLIRTKSDRGVVVVGDPRLVTKSYGAIFRKSIAASVHTVSDREELLRRVEDFFAED